MKKSILLVITLAIPVSVFLFLKFFGTNTFEVRYLFDEGIPNCPNSSSPHKVPNFEYIGETGKQFNSNQLEGFLIYGVLDASETEQNKKLIVELVRIQDAFFEIGSPYFLIFINGNSNQRREMESLCSEMGLAQKSSCIAYLEHRQLSDFLKCGIALIDENSDGFSNLVLADPQKRIRGIYNGLDIEQTDQLILELKILKEQL
ncbi:MAG: hypothetical protein KAR17_18150 [Cyclobacteriaceae bacterium]|nr:hypothetical protein [Cyclobacteriaceae bacterium]